MHLHCAGSSSRLGRGVTRPSRHPSKCNGSREFHCSDRHQSVQIFFRSIRSQCRLSATAAPVGTHEGLGLLVGDGSIQSTWEYQVFKNGANWVCNIQRRGCVRFTTTARGGWWEGETSENRSIVVMVELHQLAMFAIVCDVRFTAFASQVQETFTRIVGWEIEMESHCILLIARISDTMNTQVV